MRLRYTLILALLLIGLGAYLYFVESKQIAEEGKKEKLVTVDADDVTAVTLVYPDREIALEKSDGVWRMTKPVQAPADDITVKNLIRAVSDAEVTKTIDPPPADLAQFGLVQPTVTVKLSTKDAALPDLKVGKTTAVSFSTYVQRADQPKLYLTGSAFHSGMDKQVKDLRDKKIVECQEDAVTRLALRGPEGDVVLAKSDSNWKIEQPAAYRADGNAVRSLLSAVHNLRATDFASDAPTDADLANYGLDTPQRQVLLNAGDGKEIRLLVGKETDQGLYVKSADTPTTYVVGKFVARDLSKGIGDLRDKTVLSFDPGAPTAIEVAHGDGRFTLRSADGKWSLEGSDQAINDAVVSSFVGTLSRLSGSQVLADSTADLGAYGLATPPLTITVKGKDNVLIGAVRAGPYGDSQPATYAVKREDDPTVFQLRDFQFKQIDKQPADFVAAPPPPPGVPQGAVPLDLGDEE